MLKYALKHFPYLIGKLLFISVEEILVLYVPFSRPSILYLIRLTYVNLLTFEEYFRKLKRAQIDRRSKRIHKPFSALLESIKKGFYAYLAIILSFFYVI